MRPGPKAGMAPRGLLHGVGGLGCTRVNRSQLSGGYRDAARLSSLGSRPARRVLGNQDEDYPR